MMGGTLLVGLLPSSLGASHRRIPAAAGLPLYHSLGLKAVGLKEGYSFYPK